MSRFVVIILDGFGIGALEDTAWTRPEDTKANTLASILSVYPDLKLPTLEQLGLMNAAGFESRAMKFSATANYGKAALVHDGADTFMGHQEIMGTLPMKPQKQCLNDQLETVEAALIAAGYRVQRIGTPALKYFLVDEFCTVSDNIDSDLGQAINCIAPLDQMPFEKVLAIAKVVRNTVTLNRVIAFGGTGNTITDILSAEDIKENRYIGNVAVKTKSYQQGYQVLHLGYGVDPSVQVPSLLNTKSIPTVLLGKVADVVQNPYGKSVSCVNTQEVLQKTIDEFINMKNGLLATNVQETDLAGHSMNTAWYKSLLETVDSYLEKLVVLMKPEDLLVIMADHGNDPEIGHNRHTREYVPLLIHQPGVKGVAIGARSSLSDVGASICAWFDCPTPQNGISFTSLLPFQNANQSE